MKFLFSLKNKLILSIGLILLSGFLISNQLSFFVARDSLNKNTLNEILPLISNSIYSEIQRELMQPIHNTSLMAQDSFVIDWVNQGEKAPSLIKNYLHRIQKKYAYSSVFFISDKTKNYYHYKGLLKQISPDNPKDSWYYDFIKLNRPYDLDVDTDEGDNKSITIFINHRLENSDGKFLGAIGAGLRLEDIGNKLKNYQDRFNRVIYMVDSNGLIQVHPDKDLVGRQNIKEMPGISQISQQLLSEFKQNRSYSYEVSGETNMISVRYFADFDWFMIVQENENESLVQIKTMFWTNTIIGICITLLVLFIIAIILHWFHIKIEKAASIDELTGLYNRRLFIQNFNQKRSAAKRHHSQQCLMLIDIDHFKQVNDSYGHQVGDEVLRQISRCMLKELRQEDLIGRWGGEEFATLLTPVDKETALLIAERLRKQISSLKIKAGKKEITCSISIGLAMTENGEWDLDELISSADDALYQAKNKGRDQVVLAAAIEKASKDTAKQPA